MTGRISEEQAKKFSLIVFSDIVNFVNSNPETVKQWKYELADSANAHNKKKEAASLRKKRQLKKTQKGVPLHV